MLLSPNFKRAPAGRMHRNFNTHTHNRSYSKTDKPLLFKLTRLLHFKNKHRIWICFAMSICCIFIVLIILAPSAHSSVNSNTDGSGTTQTQSEPQIIKSSMGNIHMNNNKNNNIAVSSLHSDNAMDIEYQNVLNIIKTNASKLGVEHVSQIFKYRNELQLELDSIDSVISENSQQIAEILAGISANAKDNDNDNGNANADPNANANENENHDDSGGRGRGRGRHSYHNNQHRGNVEQIRQRIQTKSKNSIHHNKSVKEEAEPEPEEQSLSSSSKKQRPPIKKKKLIEKKTKNNDVLLKENDGMKLRKIGAKQKQSTNTKDGIHIHKNDNNNYIAVNANDNNNNMRALELSTDEFTPDLILPNLSDIRRAIVKEFAYAWNAYSSCAFGQDTLHPLSCTGDSNGFAMGLTIIDSLDTMIIMNRNEKDSNSNSNSNHDHIFDVEIAKMKEWITNEMKTDAKKEVSFFECTIRILGGLLSAYALTNDEIYKLRAQQLGDKLILAFDTESGIPFSSVNLKASKGFNPGWARSSTSTSEAASVQLEFNYLSFITNDNKYAEKARKAQELVMSAQRASSPPLLRKWISLKNAKFTDAKISIGSRIDSSYEYYLKVPLQLSHHPRTDDIWKIYMESMDTIEEKLFQYTRPHHYLYVSELVGGHVSDQFDHLACFIGGSFASGSLLLSSSSSAAMNDSAIGLSKLNDLKNPKSKLHLEYGKEITKTCASIYMNTNTGLAPEIVYFHRLGGDEKKKEKEMEKNGKKAAANEDTTEKLAQLDFEIHSRDTHNLLRPETVESLFHLYRVTHDVKYRKWAYKIFLAFKEYTRVEVGGGTHPSSMGGYASINDVTVKTKQQITYRGDTMESFFMSETLKYLYLIFCEDHVMNHHDYVFNTEAHPLPILTLAQANRLFS